MKPKNKGRYRGPGYENAWTAFCRALRRWFERMDAEKPENLTLNTNKEAL